MFKFETRKVTVVCCNSLSRWSRKPTDCGEHSVSRCKNQKAEKKKLRARPTACRDAEENLGASFSFTFSGVRWVSELLLVNEPDKCVWNYREIVKRYLRERKRAAETLHSASSSSSLSVISVRVKWKFFLPRNFRGFCERWQRPVGRENSPPWIFDVYHLTNLMLMLI